MNFVKKKLGLGDAKCQIYDLESRNWLHWNALAKPRLPPIQGMPDGVRESGIVVRIALVNGRHP